MRHQRAETFRFSLPLVSVLHDPIDGRREKFLCFVRFLFQSAQLFHLDAQQVHFDEQQLHFPPHYGQRIGHVPRLGPRKCVSEGMNVRSGLIWHAQ